jgi:hypothetical protein
MASDGAELGRLAWRGRWLLRAGVWAIFLFFPLSTLVLCMMRGDPGVPSGLQPHIDAPGALAGFYSSPLTATYGWTLKHPMHVDERISMVHNAMFYLLLISAVIVGFLRRWALVGVLVGLMLIPDGAFHARPVAIEAYQQVGGQPLTAPGPPLLDLAKVPLSLQRSAHYALAQQDYFRNDAAGVAAQLTAIGDAPLPPASDERTDRIWVLEDFAHAYGFRTPTPPLHRRMLLAIPATWAPPILQGLNVSLLLGFVAIAVGLWINRRVRRLGSISARSAPKVGIGVELQLSALAARASSVLQWRGALALTAVTCLAVAALLWAPSADTNGAFHQLSCPMIWAMEVNGKLVRAGGWAVTPFLFVPWGLGGLAGAWFVFRGQAQWIAVTLALTVAGAQGFATIAGYLGDSDMRHGGQCQTDIFGIAVPLNAAFNAAQLGYLRGDVAATAQQLDRMRLSGEPNETVGMPWRVAVMREWAAHHGAQLRTDVYQGEWSLGLQRLIDLLCLWSALVLGVAALALSVLSGQLTRRLGRVRSLVKSLASSEPTRAMPTAQTGQVP